MSKQSPAPSRSSAWHGIAWIVLAMVALALPFFTPPAGAYVEAAHSLGQVINLSSNIVLMRVTAVDRKENSILFAKVRDLKGKHPQEVIRHRIGRGGFEPREWQTIMNWVDVGKEAIFMHNGSASETFTGNYWYQAYGNPGEANGWWSMSHGEPFLLRTYAGKVDRFVGAIQEILAGKEIIVPCMVDGNKEDLKAGKARIQRMKASLKLQDYNAKRDFAGWGGEDFQRLMGMPGFTHLSTLPRVDPDAQAISAADFNGDGKMDLCLVGGGRVVLSQNGGDSFTEVSLPGVSGARAAVWADYNADGLPDLLLATASGPMLLTNLGKGSFRDDSHLLPAEPAYNLTCAAWIDQNGDGRPDILLGNGWHGLRLYRNSGPTSGDAPAELGPWRFVGPFDNTGRRGLREPFAPEKDLNLKGDFTGKAGRKIAWKEGKFVDGKINSLALFDNNQDAVIYLHREIRCPKAMKLPVSLGNDEGLAVWLNGKLLVAQENDRACAPDQLLLELDLKAGSNDLLLKFTQGIGEWAFYFQPGTKSGAPRTWNFEDVSDAVGLGVAGLGSKEKGDALTVADLDGDGKLDFLYSAGTGRVARNEGNRFVEMVASGLQFPAGKVGPIPGDYDGDGLIDLVVPLAEGLRLFRNQGKGSFADVTRAAGLGDVKGRMVSADWGDLDNDGKLDLVVGCLRGSNRFFRGKGDGTFSDASESIGLNQRVFNTQAIRLLDLNGDGILDLACNNEGQEPCVLLANPDTFARQTPVTVLLAGKQGILGSQVRVLNQDGKLVANQQILGGEGRGGQTPPLARFALAPGSYRLEWLLSTGRRGQKPLVVEKTHVKTVLDSAVLPGE